MKSSCFVSLCCSWVILFSLIGAPSARKADSAKEFQRHYDASQALYKQGQVEEAITELQAAYAIKQLPKLLLNLGQAHRKLGHAREALGYYEFYLRVEPNPKPELRAELDGYIASCRAMMEAAERARGQIPAGNEPLTPPTAPASAQAVPAATASPAPSPTSPPPDLMPKQSAVASALAPAPAEAKPVYKKWWFWTIIGVAVAGGVAGAVAGTVGQAPGLPSDLLVRSPNWQ